MVGSKEGDWNPKDSQGWKDGSLFDAKGILSFSESVKNHFHQKSGELLRKAGKLTEKYEQDVFYSEFDDISKAIKSFHSKLDPIVKSTGENAFIPENYPKWPAGMYVLEGYNDIKNRFDKLNNKIDQLNRDKKIAKRTEIQDALNDEIATRNAVHGPTINIIHSNVKRIQSAPGRINVPTETKQEREYTLVSAMNDARKPARRKAPSTTAKDYQRVPYHINGRPIQPTSYVGKGDARYLVDQNPFDTSLSPRKFQDRKRGFSATTGRSGKNFSSSQMGSFDKQGAEYQRRAKRTATSLNPRQV